MRSGGFRARFLGALGSLCSDRGRCVWGAYNVGTRCQLERALQPTSLPRRSGVGLMQVTEGLEREERERQPQGG